MSAPTPRPTRGRSRPGRLRLLDRYLELCEADLLARRDGPWAQARVVDLGLGAQAHCTQQWAHWLQRRWPQLDLVGVDQDPRRVGRARRHHPASNLSYQQGGFDLEQLGPLRLVRALNLLRGYDAAQVPAAWDSMGAPLLPGGLLVEGSTDQAGSALAAHLLRRSRSGLLPQALLFASDFSAGFAPAMFRGVLPRLLRDDAATLAFLDCWTQAWRPHRGQGRPGAIFARAARAVCTSTPEIPPHEELWNAGILIWRAPDPGPGASTG